MTDQIIIDHTPPDFNFTEAWSYIVKGKPFGVMARYDRVRGEGRPKEYRPFLPVNGKLDCKGFPTPRPLYNVDALAERTHAPVLIVEGEKTADAAAKLFPDHVVVTSQGGAKAVGKTDWSPLQKRRVTILPDNDAAGATYARKILEHVPQWLSSQCHRIFPKAGTLPIRCRRTAPIYGRCSSEHQPAR